MAYTVNGKGSYWEIRPGYYKYRFSLGKDPQTGKYRYSPKRTLHCKSKNKRGREAELRSAMEAYKQELINGYPIVSHRSKPLTVGEYATQFHKLRAGTLNSPLSYEREAIDINHIIELFGDIRITALSAPIIKRTYSNVRESSRFSQSELHKIHAKLSQIMKEAVNDEIVPKNPCLKISVPRPQATERKALSASEAARLLQCLTSHYEECKLGKSITDLQVIPHLIGTMLLLDTGMRRGEMLALDWGHTDLESGTVHITLQFARDKQIRAPKSRKSRRFIHLSDTLVSVLREWKELQVLYFIQIAKEQTPSTPIANNALGEYLDPNNFNRWFRNWCVDNQFGHYSGEQSHYYDSKGRKRYRKKGYTGLTPHMLRHTQATLLIGANTDIKTVQNRLGHASADMTINTYSHAIAQKDAEAASTFSELLNKY
jgi:integrase